MPACTRPPGALCLLQVPARGDSYGSLAASPGRVGFAHAAVGACSGAAACVQRIRLSHMQQCPLHMYRVFFELLTCLTGRCKWVAVGPLHEDACTSALKPM